jgi:hypothetical protein
MSPEKKRETMDKIDQRIVELAREAVEAYHKIE